VSAKGCLSLAIVALIALWTALMGGLIAAGFLGLEAVGLVVRAVFGDTPEAQHAIEAILDFVRGTAGSFLGLIWGLGTAALLVLWLVAWRSARDAPAGGMTIRVDDDSRAFREMKDVTPRDATLPPPSGPGDDRR
jgi:ABC-type Na+ efflux pump permease subunit